MGKVDIRMEAGIEKEGNGRTDLSGSVDFKVASYADFFFSYSALAISVAELYG